MKKWKKILLTTLSGVSSVAAAYIISLSFIMGIVYKMTDAHGVSADGGTWYTWHYVFDWYAFLYLAIGVIMLATFILTTIFIWCKPLTDEQIKENEIARLEAKLNKLKNK